MLDKVSKTDARVSLYQPEQEGLIFPEVPTFKDFAAEREYPIKSLPTCFRL